MYVYTYIYNIYITSVYLHAMEPNKALFSLVAIGQVLWGSWERSTLEGHVYSNAIFPAWWSMVDGIIYS